MADRQPWYKKYPTDWRGDTNLRACGLAARGLWDECLGLMHEAEPRGYLVFAGEPVSVEKLALLVSRPLKEVRAALAELERAGVPSRDERGTIYSRRMVRDTARSAKASADGARGGNPTLKGGVNGHVKPQLIPAGAQTRVLSSDPSGSGLDEHENPDLTAARFETFWDAYPRKVAKQDAEKVFTKLNPDHALLATMLSAIARQKASHCWRELRFVPHPDRWLRGRRWADEPATVGAPAARQLEAPAWHAHCPHLPKCVLLTQCAEAWAVERARVLDESETEVPA